MANHPNRSSIIQLDALDPTQGSKAYREFIERARKYRSESDFAVNPHVEVIRCDGNRYWLAALNMMTDGAGLAKLKAGEVDLYDEQVAHAIKQIIKLRYPERKHIEVEPRIDLHNGDTSAHVWWNQRKQYEQVYFSITA